MNKFIRPSDDRLKERRNKSYRSTAEERGIRGEEMRRRTRREKEKIDAQPRFAAADARPTTASYRVIQLHDSQEAGHEN